MSIALLRLRYWRPLALVLTATAVVLSGCGTGRTAHGGEDSDLDPDFLRAVATAEAVNFKVYWLGRDFTVDGLVFRGPDVADFGGEVQGGGVGMEYFAEMEGGGTTGLHVVVYSSEGWERARDRVTNPGVPGVSRRSVNVAGRDAQLFSAPGGTRPVNALWLILDLGDAVIEAGANSGGPVYPGGPDYSPFINNPDLLLQVLEENLRPYPE